MKRYDLIGVENLIVDLLMKIDYIPKSDNQSELLDILWQPGGNASNAVVAATLLGSKCAMIGLSGNDQYGAYALSDLKKHNIDISRCYKSKGDTAISVCMSENFNKKRSFLGKKARLEEIHLSQEDFDMVLDSHCVHFSHADCVIRESLLQFAHENGVITSFDGGFYRTVDEQLYPYIDILIVSQEYYETCMEQNGREREISQENLKWLQQKGPKTIVVTLGSEGSVGVDGESYNQMSGINGIPITDTIGAGDAFHGAFLHKYIHGAGFEESMEYATTVSYLACFGLGARTSLPTLEHVEEYLESKKIDFDYIQKRFNYYKKVVEFTLD